MRKYKIINSHYFEDVEQEVNKLLAVHGNGNDAGYYWKLAGPLSVVSVTEVLDRLPEQSSGGVLRRTRYSQPMLWTNEV